MRVEWAIDKRYIFYRSIIISNLVNFFQIIIELFAGSEKNYNMAASDAGPFMTFW